MNQTVFVGLSGGVDSSVSALLLKRAGYNVVGVYMKNWSKDLPGFECPWKDDYIDAKRVAVQLGIDFELFDFEPQYEERVVKYMIEEYRIGRTPNPDIMCNQEIKFKLFYDVSREKGARYIATGHYARTKNGELYMGLDPNKDQSYFLYRVTKEALKNTIFPIGELHKPNVRQLASENHLITANKKESMGICFVGKVGIREFLGNYVTSEPGPIIDQNGLEVGSHDGALFYTIGQRQGLRVGGGLPMYVTGKDIDKNIVYVTTKIDDSSLWKDKLNIVSPHWIGEEPEPSRTYAFRVRYRAPLVKGRLSEDLSEVHLDEPVRAVTPGQSVAIYENDKLLGGGIVA